MICTEEWIEMRHLITKYIVGLLMLTVVFGGMLMAGHSQAASHTCTSACQSAANVKQMIRTTFGRYAPHALRVAACESGYNPAAYNPYSGAMGVFQFMPYTWSRTPFARSNPFEASANIHAAYYVFVRDGYSWREWYC
jgi:hypothetical protein